MSLYSARSIEDVRRLENERYAHKRTGTPGPLNFLGPLRFISNTLCDGA